MTAPHPSPGSPEIPLRLGSKPRFLPSRKAAIAAFCKSCIYDPGAGGAWREQVERCTATDCPLYPVRPQSYRRADDAAAQGRAE